MNFQELVLRETRANVPGRSKLIDLKPVELVTGNSDFVTSAGGVGSYNLPKPNRGWMRYWQYLTATITTAGSNLSLRRQHTSASIDYYILRHLTIDAALIGQIPLIGSVHSACGASSVANFAQLIGVDPFLASADEQYFIAITAGGALQIITCLGLYFDIPV